MVCIQERRACDGFGLWLARLESWGFGYLYRELLLRDDVLDTCSDSAVKEYFDKKIKRGSGIPRRTKEKFGRPKMLITNDLIRDFQLNVHKSKSLWTV